MDDIFWQEYNSELRSGQLANEGSATLLLTGQHSSLLCAYCHNPDNMLILLNISQNTVF